MALQGLHERLLNVYREPFKRITYTEAVELLNHPDHVRAGARRDCQHPRRRRRCCC